MATYPTTAERECFSVSLALSYPAGLNATIEVLGAGNEIAPPVVSIVSPAPNTPLGRSQEVVIEVSDDSRTFKVLEIQVQQGVREVAFDDGAFLNPYAASSREFVDEKIRFTIRRVGGWDVLPRFRVRAIDLYGNQAGGSSIIEIPEEP